MHIVLLHYIKPLSAIEAHLEEHRQFLEQQFAAGHFVMAGPQVPRMGGAILARGLTREQLDEVLARDPFHREQLVAFEIVEFTPTQFGAGLEKLLKEH